uniref:Uncharacterized protein n=1 Tax=Anguilla anguilla TaxID=7936 RepID=A0A0E9QGY8_ANGAN
MPIAVLLIYLFLCCCFTFGNLGSGYIIVSQC